MKKIRLPKGKFCLVDDEDYEFLNMRDWKCYQERAIWRTSHGTIQMSRYVLRNELKDPNLVVDHINHNTLDNRKENLRICTRQQNLFNKLVTGQGTSKYKGVSWQKRAKKWRASIGLGGRIKWLGDFPIENDAAKAYNTKAKELYGEFANLNVII